MNWLTIRRYDEQAGALDVLARAYASQLTTALDLEQLAEHPRVFGAACTPADAALLLEAFASAGGLSVDAVLPLEAAHWAGISTRTLDEVVAARPATGDHSFLARFRTEQGAPVFLGAIVREGRLLAVFDGLRLWNSVLRAARS